MKEKLKDATQDLYRIGLVIGCVTAVSGLLGFHVWNQYRITQIGYEISQVTSDHRALMEENKKLAIEVAVQGRAERMTSLARERYGLEPLKPAQVWDVSKVRDAGGPLQHASLEADLE